MQYVAFRMRLDHFIANILVSVVMKQFLKSFSLVFETVTITR